MKRNTLLLIGVLSALLMALVGGAAAGGGGVSPLGSMFRLNATTLNDQAVNSVDFDASGGFVAVWDGHGDGAYGYAPDVFARQFDAAGQPKGDEIVVNTFLEGYQDTPIVGVAPGGEFLVTYFDGAHDLICSQYYSAAGVAAHPDSCLIVNNQVAVSTHAFYDMDMSPDGEHAAVAFGHLREVYIQSLSAQGHPVGGAEVLVADDGDLWEFPAVAVDNDGDIVVVWKKADAPGCEGSFMFMARRYNANKVPQGNAFEVACGSDVDVAMNAGGKFVILWDALDGDGSGVFARRFNANGSADGPSFRVNQATAGMQNGANAAMNAAGDLYVTWSHSVEQIWGIPTDWPIMGRVYPATGPAGDEFRVTAYPGGNPGWGRAAIDPDGRILTAWTNWGQDGSNYGSYAQFGRPELPNVTVLLSTLADGRIGSLSYARGDVLAYDRAAAAWSLYFDASAHGLTKDVADFALLPDGDLLLIVKAAADLPGAGKVQPQDVVRFDVDSGGFSLYFDGSDVGLTKMSEKLDALAVDADGSLLLSTAGGVSVGAIRAYDQDLLRFAPTQTGPNTAGEWSLVLPGLGYRMPKDVQTVWADTAADDLYLYMTFDRTVKVSNDYQIPRGTIMRCRPYYPNANGGYSSCLIDLYWDAHEAGLPAKARIDGLELLVGN